MCFTDIERQCQHAFPTCAESSKEVSPKQDKARAPEKRHLPKLPSDWPAEADPDKQGFPSAQQFVPLSLPMLKFATR